MLTSEILEKQFITAHFIDNERTQIEIVTLEHLDGRETITTVIPYDETHPWCQDLLKVCSLDTLHSNTWTKINKEKKEFEKMAMQIAEKAGIITQMKENISSNALIMLEKYIFEFEESFPKTATEELFNFKLWLFKIDSVKNCENDEIKTKIRKAKSPKEALQAVFEIK